MASNPTRRGLSADSAFRRVRTTRTPTALPRKNKAKHNNGNVLASEAKMPNTEVRNNVALNAVVRPMRSLPMSKSQCQQKVYEGRSVHSHVPHPTAPNIIPPNMEDDKRPIYLSCTGRNAVRLRHKLKEMEARGQEEVGEDA